MVSTPASCAFEAVCCVGRRAAPAVHVGCVPSAASRLIRSGSGEAARRKPDDPHGLLIKRLIALEGDTVSLPGKLRRSEHIPQVGRPPRPCSGAQRLASSCVAAAWR